MTVVYIAIFVFLAVVLFLEGAYYAYQALFNKEAVRLQERLREWPDRTETQTRPDIVRRQVLSDIPWLDHVLGRLRRLSGLQRLHEQAAGRMPFGAYLLLSLLLAAVGIMVALNLKTGVLIGLGLTVLGGSLPFLFLYWKKRQRRAVFEGQLPEGLELIARALRAGHAFLVGMKLVGEEFSDPIGTEFKRAVEEVAMGVPVTEALQDLAMRLESLDMKFFVTAVTIQRETGGNLAEIIEALGRIIRKRFELRAKIKALSVEGKLSAIILFTLPFAMGLLMYLVSPGYFQILVTDPVGQTLLIAGGALMTAGAIVTKNMIAVEA